MFYTRDNPTQLPYVRDNPTQQQALAFLVSQLSYVEPVVYRMKYPELNYAEMVPVVAIGNEWAKSITFFSVDMVGQADWFHTQASDIPLADFARGKAEVAIEMAAIGYRYNLEELGQQMMLPGTNIGTERAASCRRAYEEFVYNVALYGDVRKNWLGLTNHTSPPVINTAHTWAYDLAQTTPLVQQILTDFNSVLVNIWQGSLTVEMANTVLLPLSALATLAIAQLPNTTMNVLQFIKQNNIYTQTTGQELTIRAVRGLDTAGASGNGRMIAYNNNPEILRFHIPMPHKFMPVWQRTPLVFDVPGIFRLGGLEIRRPLAFRFLDGVC
jgi:hypothetical protein